MLDVYWGEFLVSPIPLEMSLNYCSHKCAYCFANLNQPGRKANVKAIMRLLQDYQNRNTLAATLLKAGYPVLVSNRVDPFAASNYQQAVPILRVLTDMGFPVAIQTKGGRGVDEVLEFLPLSAWYISVGMLDESTRRAIEPGAPDIESRFRLMSDLTERGHKVVLGLNPLVSEWLPNPMPLLERAKACGATGAWIERLHLNRKQQANLSARERKAMTLPVLERAGKRKPTGEDLQLYYRARECAEAIGLEVFGVGQSNRSDFFKPYRELYPKTFPVMQDFINYCHDDPLEGLIDFQEFSDYLSPSLPSGVHSVGHYLGATAHNIWQTHKLSNNLTYNQLLALVWSDARISQCPARFCCFAYAGELETDGWLQVVDDNDMPFLVFSKDGYSEYFTEVN